MSEARFFAPDLEATVIVLTGPEAAHLRDARRLGVGQTVTLFDGRGGQVRAEILTLARDRVELRPHWREHRGRPTATVLCLAAAVCKGPRQDWLIEKCTELGVAELVPLVSGRSVVRPAAGRVERWRRRCIEAAKQSQQAWLPTIHPPQPLAVLLAEARPFDRAWLADPQAPTSLCQELCRLPNPPSSAVLLIGPEGGFEPQELSDAEQAGFVPLRLGPTILRVETAAVAAAAMVLMCEGVPAEAG